jgi:hypothetical protein
LNTEPAPTYALDGESFPRAVERLSKGGRPSFRNLDGLIARIPIEESRRPRHWEGSLAQRLLELWPEPNDNQIRWIQEASSPLTWWQYAALISLVRRGMSPAEACRVMEIDLSQWSRFARTLLRLTEGEDV